MKKLFFVTFTVLFACNLNAQTPALLRQKLDQAPANEFEVKRINYGVWDDKANTHIWAYYQKSEGYVLCKLQNGILRTTNIVDDKQASKDDLLKEVKKLKSANWIPVKW